MWGGGIRRADIARSRLAKGRSVDRGDCGVVAELHVLTGLWGRGVGVICEWLLALEGARHANVQ